MSDEKPRSDQLLDDQGRSPGVPRRDPDIGGTPAVVGAPTREEATEAGPALEGRRASLWADAWRELRRNPMFLVSGTLIVLFLVMAAFPQMFTGADPRACSLSNSLQRPSAEHWFGFDVQGCDYYANVVYGARVSMSIGLVVVLFASVIAIVFGTLSAFYGGWVDTITSRITDIALGMPFILAAIVILTVLPQNFFTVAAVLILLGWTTMLRLMRSSVLEQKEADYVDAARVIGASDLRIMVKHILPNAITSVIVYGTIFIGIVISVEATLSFLGVGLVLPAISWGILLSEAQNRVLNAPHLLFFPGLFLSLAILSFILMGDALRDAFDPKLR
jgi:ABC-type dipeptide/oligopeptide/nickel transport system permease subunit